MCICVCSYVFVRVCVMVRVFFSAFFFPTRLFESTN